MNSTDHSSYDVTLLFKQHTDHSSYDVTLLFIQHTDHSSYDVTLLFKQHTDHSSYDVTLLFNILVPEFFFLILAYLYTGCNRRNGPDFGRVFLMLNYTDITQNTYIQS